MMNEITAGAIRRWVRSGIRRYLEYVQAGMTEGEAIDVATWSLIESETELADRVVRNGIALYMQAVDDGISEQDAKESAVAVVSDIILGEQMVERVGKTVEAAGSDAWVSWPEVMVTKGYAVDLVGRLVAGIAGPFGEFPVVFEGRVSPLAEEGKAGE